MFEILMYLFESYFDAGSYPAPDKLSRKLSAAGFEGDEISEALTWLSALQQQNPDSYPASLEHAGLRHFAELELQRISYEARQFLLFPEQQHMISRCSLRMGMCATWFPRPARLIPTTILRCSTKPSRATANTSMQSRKQPP